MVPSHMHRKAEDRKGHLRCGNLQNVSFLEVDGINCCGNLSGRSTWINGTIVEEEMVPVNGSLDRPRKT